MADEEDIIVSPWEYNSEFYIQITHVPSGKGIKLYTFLTSFSDSYKTNFKSTPVYGRMDPIINYQNTTRTINISLVVPASHLFEAVTNFDTLKTLAHFQYPSYQNINYASGIASPPICKLSFNNLVDMGEGDLYGFFNGFDFAPVNDAGYFVDEISNIYPKEYKVSLSFTALHTTPPGWKGKRFTTDKSTATTNDDGDVTNGPTDSNDAATQANLGGGGG